MDSKAQTQQVQGRRSSKANNKRTEREQTCEQLAALPVSEVFEHLRAMLRHTTGNPDERAILRLLQCLGCDQVASQIWNAVSGHSRYPTWGQWILEKFHGREREQLLIWLRSCGILDFRT